MRLHGGIYRLTVKAWTAEELPDDAFAESDEERVVDEQRLSFAERMV